MKQFATNGSFGVLDHEAEYLNNNREWHSDSVIPLSDRPEDRGLYIVTTLDRFFQLDLEQSGNVQKKATGTNKPLR